MTTPTQQTWTLRLKSHRTTILLHIDPLQTFSSIKATLHTALSETGLQASEHGPCIALPSSPDDIKLGRPIDPLDPSHGFELGEWEEQGDEDEDEDSADGEGEGKGKGKGRAGEKRGEVKECPKGAGLKDGAVLAFRWDGDGVAVDGKGWGVQMASFEDAYGVVNEADGGARAEFEG
ncbi:hypothetical protein ST47_g3914 [Ascochyta rabiei]|uniref:Uncharacterized protein n=1 Tax=Didymella rabiei TaxID=5454 RepID=A0A163GKV3_DIDRA|nr:hypothetical protein ST47_g3914 [Ascochyta rabiei]